MASHVKSFVLRSLILAHKFMQLATQALGAVSYYQNQLADATYSSPVMKTAIIPNFFWRRI